MPIAKGIFELKVKKAKCFVVFFFYKIFYLVNFLLIFINYKLVDFVFIMLALHNICSLLK